MKTQKFNKTLDLYTKERSRQQPNCTQQQQPPQPHRPMTCRLSVQLSGTKKTVIKHFPDETGRKRTESKRESDDQRDWNCNARIAD